MSAISRRTSTPSARPGPHGSGPGSGFSLIELLVVLTLVGFVAGLTVPRLTNMYQSVQFAQERDSLMESIAALGQQARLEGRLLRIQSTEDLRQAGVSIPSAWEVEVLEPWRIRANGSCDSGRISLKGRGRTVTVRLTRPFCNAELAS